jgi:hypothetical protein
MVRLRSARLHHSIVSNKLASMISRRAFVVSAGSMPLARLGGARALSYFTPEEHAAVILDPTYIGALYARHRTRFRADLGSGFAAEIEQHFMFGFCGLVAFDLKPYGASVAVTMTDLLEAPALDCDNYAVLMWRLFDILCPDATTNIAAVGWHNGPIGNHAQMHCQKDADSNGKNGGYWLVDPTVGIMLCGWGFDGVARGMPVGKNSQYLKSFHAACGRTGSVTQWLHDAARGALVSGLYRPSQLLYYYVDLDRYIAPIADFADWMTPQGSSLAP